MVEKKNILKTNGEQMNTEETKPTLKITETLEIKNSSNISAISYTNTDSMIVRFKNGGEYLYKKVPKETYQAMAKSESAGKYLNSMVKGKFEYEQVDTKKIEKDLVQAAADINKEAAMRIDAGLRADLKQAEIKEVGTPNMPKPIDGLVDDEAVDKFMEDNKELMRKLARGKLNDDVHVVMPSELSLEELAELEIIKKEDAK